MKFVGLAEHHVQFSIRTSFVASAAATCSVMVVEKITTEMHKAQCL
jgi:hypothetical protein